MTTATIPECVAGDDLSAAWRALDTQGCLVIRDAASPQVLAAVRAELQEPLAAAKLERRASVGN